jgi:hypothetical protein
MNQRILINLIQPQLQWLLTVVKALDGKLRALAISVATDWTLFEWQQINIVLSSESALVGDSSSCVNTCELLK